MNSLCRLDNYLNGISYVPVAFVNGTKEEMFQASARRLVQALQHWVRTTGNAHARQKTKTKAYTACGQSRSGQVCLMCCTNPDSLSAAWMVSSLQVLSTDTGLQLPRGCKAAWWVRPFSVYQPACGGWGWDNKFVTIFKTGQKRNKCKKMHNDQPF